jgi:O-antigen ligase
MKVFLISTLFPFLMISYEIIFGPVNPYTPGGREFDRYRGLYADGINYTIYWLIGLITTAYFYLKESTVRHFTAFTLALVFSLTAISLFYLNQAAAYFIFAFLFIVILIFVYKKNKLHFLTLSFALTVILLLVYLPEIEKPASLFRVDAEIVKGNVEIIHGANGRVWIWLEGLKQLNELPFYSWLFGAGLSQTVSLKYFSAGAHSDYIRILFSTGLVGLLLYLFFIGSLFKGLRLLPPENKFLLLSVIGSLLLFSFTHTPAIYLPFMYFLTIILAKGERRRANGIK